MSYEDEKTIKKESIGVIADKEVKKRKKSKLALVSLILGVLYFIYIVSYFGSSILSSDSSEALGAGLASLVVGPHVLVTGLGVLFNGLGYFMNRRNFVLVGGILYTVAIVLFPLYFMFVLIQAILSYIAYAKMPKI